MNTLDLARWQFGITTVYHFFMVPLTIGLIFILLYTAFNIPFSVWMIKSFFDELNREVDDAARMDGSSEARVFFKICLPQVTAGLAATFVFGLILTWNEFLFALLLTGVETRTVPVAMARTLCSTPPTSAQASSGRSKNSWVVVLTVGLLARSPARVPRPRSADRAEKFCGRRRAASRPHTVSRDGGAESSRARP